MVSCEEGGFVGLSLFGGMFFVVGSGKFVRWLRCCVAESGAESASVYG